MFRGARSTPLLVVALVMFALVWAFPSQSAQAVTPRGSARPESVGEIMSGWAASGRVSPGGTWSDQDGRRLLVALSQISPQREDSDRPSYLTAGASPRPCQGIFENDKASVVTLQQSPVYGIPWIIRLTPMNEQFGVVTLSAQIYADSNRANVYIPHPGPWNYEFHGPLPRTFQRLGGGNYTMHPGSQVSFLWTWASTARPAQGGYSFLNCTYTG